MSSKGGYWAAANARGNAVAGRFFGATAALGQTTCALPGTMTGCIFLPAGGSRNTTTGALQNPGINGYYWGSTQGTTAISGYGLDFSTTEMNSAANALTKTRGRNLRCVQ